MLKNGVQSTSDTGITPGFMLKVSLGLIPGVFGVNKFGENSNVADGATGDIWHGVGK